MENPDHAPATKGDLKPLATKEDLAAMKADNAETRRTLSLQIERNQADIREMKETFATKKSIREEVERILGAIDAFAGQAETYRRDSLLHGQVLTEIQVELKGHDKRIERLESGS